MAGHCFECEFWGRAYEGACELISEARPGDTAFISASADDDSNLSALFMTLPSFGCPLFMLKESAE
jgi:hypothetical protein